MIKYYAKNKNGEIFSEIKTGLYMTNYRQIAELLLNIQVDLNYEYSEEKHIICYAGKTSETDSKTVFEILTIINNPDIIRKIKDYLIENYTGYSAKNLIQIIDDFLE